MGLWNFLGSNLLAFGPGFVCLFGYIFQDPYMFIAFLFGSFLSVIILLLSSLFWIILFPIFATIDILNSFLSGTIGLLTTEVLRFIVLYFFFEQTIERKYGQMNKWNNGRTPADVNISSDSLKDNKAVSLDKPTEFKKKRRNPLRRKISLGFSIGLGFTLTKNIIIYGPLLLRYSAYSISPTFFTSSCPQLSIFAYSSITTILIQIVDVSCMILLFCFFFFVNMKNFITENGRMLLSLTERILWSGTSIVLMGFIRFASMATLTTLNPLYSSCSYVLPILTTISSISIVVILFYSLVIARKVDDISEE